jgi:hypothetical protein
VKGTLGWMFTTWLTLIALQTLSTQGASGRVASLFTDVNSLVQRALDPTIPAIPDRRTGAPAPAATTAAPAAPSTSIQVPYLPGVVAPRLPGF